MALSSVFLVSKLRQDQEGEGALFRVVGFKTTARPGGGWQSLPCCWVSKLRLDQEGDGALFCVVGFKTMARPGGGWRSCAPKSRQTSSRPCLKYTFAV